MKKLYVVRTYVEAETVKEATQLAKRLPPDEVYISEDWFSKVGFLTKSDEDKEVKGLTKN